MTVRELIEALEDYDGDLEVRIAHQPSYPLESAVAGVVSAAEAIEGETPGVVYIAEGRQIGYGDRRVWEAL